MSLTLGQIKAQFDAGESEGAFLGKLQSFSKENFTLAKEQNGSPVANANITRKYRGSKGSKVVTYVNSRTGKVLGVATTAEGL